MIRSSTAIAIAAALLLSTTADAAPSDPDGAFGSSGVTTSAFPQGPTNVDASAEDLVAQPDGHLVVAGTRVVSGPSYQWLIARYSADGALDTGFGTGGRLALNEVTTDRGATAVAVQSDGTIDVTGQDASGSNAPVRVWQVSSSGTTIGSAWLAPVAGSTRTTPHAIAVQADGRVVVAGNAFIGGSEKVFVARFNSNGTPDTTFDNDGAANGVYVVPDSACDDVGSASSCTEGGLGLATDGGGVVTAIYLGGSNGGDLVGGRVFRLAPATAGAGFSIDTSYGATASTPGAAQIDRTAVNEVDALVLGSDGRVTVAGYAQSGSSFQCGFARVLASGAVDSGFGSGGATRVTEQSTCVAEDLATDAGGRLVFAGYASTGNFGAGTASTLVGRLTASGQPDTAFAPGGAAVAALGGSPSFANALLLQGAKPVVAGGAGSPHSVMLARLAGGDLASGDGGGSSGGGGGGSGGGGTTPSSKPVNTDPPQIVSSTGSTGPFRLNADLSCNPGDWLPGGYSITGYTWLRYRYTTSASSASAPPVKLADGQDYTVVPADQGNQLACVVTAKNAAGSTATSSPRTSVVARIRIPASIRRMSLEKAKGYLRRLFDGNVSFGADGASLKAIPCDFGGDQPDKNGCKATDSIEPGQVFNSTPPIGHFIDEAYGTGKLPRIVLDYYDPAKDRDNHVPAPTAKSACPATDSKAIRDDFENRVLGHYAQYARDLLTKYNCPFTETTRFNADQTVDPYVTGLETARIKGDLGYALTITAPKTPDLAATVFHRRLSGSDVYRGANLARGPLEPGLGTDGRLTVVRQRQRNDICFHVILVATGQGVPGAQIRAYAPDGEEAHNQNGQVRRATTDGNGDACQSFDINQAGTYRFTYTYYGRNGSNAEGGMSITAVNRGTAKWTTISGREMQCDAAECAQLGFTKTRAHAASLIDDIGAVFRRIMTGLFGGGSPIVDRSGAQAAAGSDGSQTATLVTAQRDNGATPGVLVVKGAVRIISQDGGSIISQDGGSIISQDGGSLISDKGFGLRVRIASIISQDGGSLVAVNTEKGASAPVIRGGATVVAVRDGRIISQDGGSIISQDGGSIISTDGASLTAPAGGAVLVVGGRVVIAGANGLLAKGTLISQDGGSAIPLSGAGIVSTSGSG